MPNGMAAGMREVLATEEVFEDELEKAPLSKTGYVGVIEVKGKYQARIQVPGDGRGGTKKRGQHSLPGLFDTPRDAAIMRRGCLLIACFDHGCFVIIVSACDGNAS